MACCMLMSLIKIHESLSIYCPAGGLIRALWSSAESADVYYKYETAVFTTAAGDAAAAAQHLLCI